MYILGIDTSCDDTGIGIIASESVTGAAQQLRERTRGDAILANVVASQTQLHAGYGGVMPEHASRAHLDSIDQVLQQALREAGLELAQIDAIAVTYGPGLVGALLVGLNYAKALAWAAGKPCLPIHHLEGHIASSVLGSDLEPPFLCLIASGGHTSLIDVQAWGRYHILGQSRDDAAGEAFDKVARLLNLPYPGGPALAALAEQGDPHAYPFTLPLQRQQGFDFSFSGLKTAVKTLLARTPEAKPADVAASFQHTVVESLYRTSHRAAKHCGQRALVIAGGVAANQCLRQRFANSALHSYFPPLALSTDNGAMIALAAARRLESGLSSPTPWQQDASPYLPL